MIMNNKCTTVPQGYANSFCEGMEKAIQYRSSKNAKGLIAGEIINTDTLKGVGTRVTIRSGDFTKQQALVNYCPFCGSPVHDRWIEKSGDAS